MPFSVRQLGLFHWDRSLYGLFHLGKFEILSDISVFRATVFKLVVIQLLKSVRYFQPLLRVLCEHTTNADERRVLEFLVSRQGAEAYLEKIRGSNLCLLDILLTFPSCNPPIQRVVEQLPRLMPRPYSVASFDPSINNFMKYLVVHWSVGKRVLKSSSKYLRKN